jgi:hypothetical protein
MSIEIGCRKAYAGLDLVLIAARTRERKMNDAGAPIPRYGEIPVKNSRRIATAVPDRPPNAFHSDLV